MDRQQVERHTFSKDERLTGRSRIHEVVTTGRTVHEKPFRLIGKVMALPTNAPAQVAFAVPKRNQKLATQRNRMKRLMREAWRLNKGPVHARLQAENKQCAWLVVYTGRGPSTFAETELKITRALARWMKEHG